MNSGQKIFVDQDIDERKNLNDGKIEDQSSTPGPTNVEINYGPFIGRKKEMY